MAFQDQVAAEVRAELARQQISGVRAAKALGWTQYYISVRLRGELPFSLADLEVMADFLEVPVTHFLQVVNPNVRKPGSSSLASPRAGESTQGYIDPPGLAA